MVVIGILFVALDQFTKYLAVVYLSPIREHVLIPGVFSLLYLENRGMAFGLFYGGRWVFVVLTIIIMSGIIYNYITLPKTRPYNVIRVMLVLLTAGAIGNLIDRVRQGFVVDMFYFSLINFPVFNVADVLVVVSVIAIGIVYIYLSKTEEKEKERTKEPKIVKSNSEKESGL